MDPVCSHCGGNAFKVFTGAHGDVLGTCVACGATRSLRPSEIAATRSPAQDKDKGFWTMAR
jgi:hypothetical protein